MKLTKEIFESYTFRMTSHLNALNESTCVYRCVNEPRIILTSITQYNEESGRYRNKRFISFIGSKEHYSPTRKKIDKFINAFNEYYSNE